MNDDKKGITSHPQKKLDLEVVGLSKQHLSQQLYCDHIKSILFLSHLRELRDKLETFRS